MRELKAFVTKDLWRKCQFPLLMALGTLPIAVLLLNSLTGDGLNALPVFPAAYAALAVLCLAVRGRLRLPAGLLGSGALAALGFLLLPVSAHPGVLLIPGLYAILLLITLPMGGWSRSREIYPAWYVVGVVAHILGQIAVNVNNRTGNHPMLGEAASMLLWSFIAFATLALLSMNRGTLNTASLGRQRVPQRMKQRNVFFTLALLALAIFLAALPEVIRAVQTAWNFLVMAVTSLFALLARLLTRSPDEGGGIGGDMAMGSLPSEAAEPSLLAQILEKAVYVLAFAAAVALVVFAVWKLYVKLKALVKALAKRLALFAQASGEDFVDEVTDTRDEGEQERVSLLGTLKKRLTRVDERKLSPGERVRYRYGRLMAKHSEWAPGQTAREGLPEDAAALYERVRYNGEELSTEEADAFSDKIRRL